MEKLVTAIKKHTLSSSTKREAHYRGRVNVGADAECGRPSAAAGGVECVGSEEAKELKEQILGRLGCLRAGLNWTVVEHKGGTWYMLPRVEPDENLFVSAMEGWLEQVAADPNTQIHVLEELALSSNADVRASVADNPNAPEYLLKALAKDESVDVRYALAENHNLADSVLSILLEDDNPYVADRAQRTVKRLTGGRVLSQRFAPTVIGLARVAATK